MHNRGRGSGHERGDPASVKAARGYAHAEAVTALQEALVHVERLSADGGRDRRRLELVLRLAHSLHRLGRLQESINLLLRHQEQLEQLEEPSLAGPYYFLLGRGYNLLGDRERATQSLQRAVAEAQRCEDKVTLGKVSYMLAFEEMWSDPLLGIEHGRRGVALLEGTGERYWLGLAHWVLGFNYLTVGEFDQALEAATRVQAIGEAIGDPRLPSWAAWLSGVIYATRGDGEAGIAACQRGLERAPIPYDTALAQGYLGYAYIEEGDPGRAIPVLEPADFGPDRQGRRRPLAGGDSSH
ncbi:MAG: hypothetical protein HYZ81_05800 [Nitrospinae bacterium]|nr:hypothetical protein [Nitrospinota bacterium]